MIWTSPDGYAWTRVAVPDGWMDDPDIQNTFSHQVMAFVERNGGF